MFFNSISSRNFSANESYNCTIPEREKECCWIYPNGCCIKTGEHQFCTAMITHCCKNKNGTIYINDTFGKIQNNYYQAIEIN